MKALWLNIGIMVVLSLGLSHSLQAEEKKMITRKDAAVIAEGTEEVRGLYGLKEGRLINCIEKKVVKPCESPWVSCVDDAWVVEFHVGETCGIEHDGRLDLIILVDAVSGNILSRFPEADYYTQPKHCLENYDCIGSMDQKQNVATCQNFIHGQVSNEAIDSSIACACVSNQCVISSQDDLKNDTSHTKEVK